MIRDLQELIRQRSVSATGEGIKECAQLVKDTLGDYGVRSSFLTLPNSAPLVYGDIKSKSNPNGPTLLFYNHYDVQPAEPLDLWDESPFSGTRRGDKIFGRGATDDKGELMARMSAVKIMLERNGDVPCNIKFVIEGEEETGSTHITKFLDKYRKKLACDAIIWEFGYVGIDRAPIIELGMKGILYVTLSSRMLKRDAHSSLAAILPSPAWRLQRAIGTIRSPDGEITIKDWDKDVRGLTAFEKKIISKQRLNKKSIEVEYGTKISMNDDEIKTALATKPTANIAGIHSGYTGDGMKTVLPSEAVAKIDFRLVPDMNPLVQFKRLKSHLKQKGFDDIEVRLYEGDIARRKKNVDVIPDEFPWHYAPTRTEPTHPFVAIVKDSAKSAFGKFQLGVSNPATGPVSPFTAKLNAPCVLIGCTYQHSRMHSPNEFIFISLMRKATECMYKIIENMPKSQSNLTQFNSTAKISKNHG